MLSILSPSPPPPQHTPRVHKVPVGSLDIPDLQVKRALQVNLENEVFQVGKEGEECLVSQESREHLGIRQKCFSES